MFLKVGTTWGNMTDYEAKTPLSQTNQSNQTTHPPGNSEFLRGNIVSTNYERDPLDVFGEVPLNQSRVINPISNTNDLSELQNILKPGVFFRKKSID